MGKNLYVASGQWANRPDDQRFLNLYDLRDAVAARKKESWTTAPKTRDLVVLPESDAVSADVLVQLQDINGNERIVAPTHWAFNQLCQYASMPANTMRSLPATLAALVLNWGLNRLAMRDDVLVLGQTNGTNILRSMTSTSYGRIWDLDVVKALIRLNERSGGIWKVPAASYASENPKRATTLYASDRDVFTFLVDDQHPIEVPGEPKPMYRGFIVSNSEVGAGQCWIMMFLYEYICDNRIIWNATNVKELKIRHNAGAPERFDREAYPALMQYANESTKQIVDGIVRAKETKIDLGEDETTTEWLMRQNKVFTKAIAAAAINAAQAEQGRVESVFDVVQGLTAYARSITHTDARVDLELAAGKLVAKVAK